MHRRAAVASTLVAVLKLARQEGVSGAEGKWEEFGYGNHNDLVKVHVRQHHGLHERSRHRRASIGCDVYGNLPFPCATMPKAFRTYRYRTVSTARTGARASTLRASQPCPNHQCIQYESKEPLAIFSAMLGD